MRADRRPFKNENRQLKKLLAELFLDNAMLKAMVGTKVVTTKQRRQVVTTLLAAYPVSQRRACREIPQTVPGRAQRTPEEAH
jgi:hypothetical protein